MGKRFPIHSSADFQKGIAMAAKTLHSGGLVAYPTESFYGLGAHISMGAALEKLFQVKSRPQTNPILILLPDRECADKYALRIPPVARRLMKAFWPGGVTLIFEAAPILSPLLTAGTGKIGMRLSSHPAATALCQAIGAPLTGTSANRSGEPPCRTAKEVIQSLEGRIDLVLDGGKTPGEKASTILDVTQNPPRILREGLVSEEQIAPFL